MAERLYKRWENNVRKGRAQKVMKVLEKQAHKALKNAMQQLRIAKGGDEEVALDAKNYLALELMNTGVVSRQAHSAQISPRLKGHYRTTERKNSSESVFEKLHAMSKTKQEIHKLNQEMRAQREMQFCTFHPQVVSNRSPSRNGKTDDLYARLAHSNKKERLEYLETQREARELRYCTFAPALPNQLQHSRSLSQHEPIHSRLHHQGELREQVLKSRQLAYKDRELDGCTFCPQTNRSLGRSASLSGRDLISNPYERLYLDNERKKSKAQKIQANREENVCKDCTFKPELIAKSKTVAEGMNESTTPRYKKLYARHMQKQLLLEQKRKELELEERKMHQLVSKMRNKPKTANQSARSLQTSPRTARRTPAFGSPRKSVVEPYERLHNLHKQTMSRKDELVKKVLCVC